MLYILVFVAGVALGYLFFKLLHKNVEYPGELVISKNDGIYLAIEPDFVDKIRYADSVTLKMHRL